MYLILRTIENVLQIENSGVQPGERETGSGFMSIRLLGSMWDVKF